MNNQIVLILDNIRSMHNVGAMFRLSDGLGVSKLYLCGITATPPRAEIHKTALGTEANVSWEYHSSINLLIPKIKQQGFTVVALELTDKAIALQDYHPTYPLALIVGHEREGVGDSALNLADVHIKIPMQGLGYSLNVSTATAIALWQLTN